MNFIFNIKPILVWDIHDIYKMKFYKEKWVGIYFSNSPKKINKLHRNKLDIIIEEPFIIQFKVDKQWELFPSKIKQEYIVDIEGIPFGILKHYTKKKNKDNPFNS